VTSDSYLFDDPRLFTVGALGEPGSRVFFLQAHEEGTTVSVKCEKQQAEALAEYLEGVLADLPAVDPSEPPPLVEPLPPLSLEWVAGTMSIGWNEATERVVLDVEELVDDEDAMEDPAHLRLQLTPSQAAGYVEQARSLASAGRPACRLCGQPIDPAGHACPRLN
jgi:uncharacterized repeat protein (TIGR03847 family)